MFVKSSRAQRQRARHLVFRVVCAAIERVGIGGLLRWLAERFVVRRAPARAVPFLVKRHGGALQVLIYHRVNDERDPIFPATPIQAFTRQMVHVSRHYRVLPLEEAVERLRRSDLPPRALVVTFDDGYRDNFLHAWPILKANGLSATFFVATGAIGTGVPLWHDRVFAAFRLTQETSLCWEWDNACVWPLTTIEQRSSALSQVLKSLWAMSPSERDEAIASLFSQLKVAGWNSEGLMMSWSDVRSMAQEGASFGAHTVTHPILSRMRHDEAVQEILQSKQILEAHLGTSVSAFAYPVGRVQDYTEKLRAGMSDLGFQCALTTVAGTNEVGQDPFSMKRATPWEPDIGRFAVRLALFKLAA